MKLSFVNILQILIGFQGLFFCVFLFTRKKGKRVINLSLGLLLALLAAHLLTHVLQDMGLVERGVTFPQLFGLLYGPLFFLYVKGLIYRDLHPGPKLSLHAVPYVVAVGAWAVGLLSPEAFAITVFVSIGSYLLVSFLALVRYRRVLRSTRSRLEAITLSWLQLSLIMMAAVFVFDVASYYGAQIGSDIVERLTSVLLFLLLLSFVTALVFKGLQHPEVYAGITGEDEAIARQGARSRTQGLDAEDAAELRRLRDFMKQERPYLDPELTIAGLAAELAMAAREVSGLINGGCGQNFCDFVNSYRIEDAKTRLLDHQNRGETVLDVLYAVGFNSKSSFNAAFKRKTGLTPTQYKIRHTT